MAREQYCGILAIPCIVMVPLSWMGIQEPEAGDPPQLSTYLAQVPNPSNYTSLTLIRQVWELLQSKAMFFVVIYSFCTPMIGNISTPAGGLVKSKWAGVKTMQNQMFSLVGSALFALGLAFVKKFCLNKSWKMMLITTTGSLAVQPIL